MRIEIFADWERGIGVINEVAMPVNRVIKLRVRYASVQCDIDSAITMEHMVDLSTESNFQIFWNSFIYVGNGIIGVLKT